MRKQSGVMDARTARVGWMDKGLQAADGEGGIGHGGRGGQQRAREWTATATWWLIEVMDENEGRQGRAKTATLEDLFAM